MSIKTPIEILEDIASESECKVIKWRLRAVVGSLQELEAKRVEQRYRQIAVLQGIKLLASWHCDPKADFGDLSPDDHVAHINARIVFECNEGLKELGVG